MIEIKLVAWYGAGHHNAMCDLLFYESRLLHNLHLEDVCLFSIHVWTGSGLCYGGSQKKVGRDSQEWSGDGKIPPGQTCSASPIFFHTSGEPVHCSQKVKTLPDYPGASWIQVVNLPASRMGHQFFFFLGGGRVKSTEFSFYRHFKGQESKIGDLLIP